MNKMSYIKSSIISLLVFCLLPFSHAFANERTINLAAIDFFPYEFEENNMIDGISVRIVRKVFKKMNQPVSIQIFPWSRAILYLKTGEIDGLFELLKTPEREAFADYGKVVLVNEIVSLFVLQDADIAFDGDYQNLRNFSIGMRKDFSYGQKFDYAVQSGILNKINIQIEPQRLLLMLNKGRIDILIGDKYGVPFLYNKMKHHRNIYPVDFGIKIRKLNPDVQSTPAFIAFSKKNGLSKIRDHFDVVLSGMKKDMSYFKTIRHWYESNRQDLVDKPHQ